MSDDLRICTACDGRGQERRIITQPQANVAMWHWVGPNQYVRFCRRCNGQGFVLAGTSVPAVTSKRVNHE